MPQWIQVRRKGDTRTPIPWIFRRPDGRQVDVTSETVKFKMLDEDGADKVPITASNITKNPTRTFTANAATNTFTSNEHPLKDGYEVVVSTTTTLPAGLEVSTRYFVVNARRNTFQLAATLGGSPIDITDSGTGTHSIYIVGSAQYAPQAADVDTAGKFYPYGVIDNGGSLEHFPANHRDWIVQITED